MRSEIEVELPQAHAAKVRDLLGGKVFRVPQYQRTYAWEFTNWKDFWEDIQEGLDSGTPHYWGTITLAKTTEPPRSDPNTASTFDVFEVVDGQQRLTTLYLFLLALSESGLPAIRERYIKCGDIYRLELGGANHEYLRTLVDCGATSKPPRKTNQLIWGALDYFKNQIREYAKTGEQNLHELSKYLQVCTFALEFPIVNEDFAIKAFQSLNDRGKPLTLLDKAKSFLMFYSSHYLQGKLDHEIHATFGQVYYDYDLLRETAEKEDVAYVTNPTFRFSEGELLRILYHYFAFHAIQKYKLGVSYSYALSTENVLDDFLKGSCLQLKQSKRQLSGFVREFLKDFKGITRSFRDLVEGTRSHAKYREILSFLGLNAAMYPLVVALKHEEILDDDLLRLVEVLDLRVYKVRGTDPRAELYKDTISQIKDNPDHHKIAENIKDNLRSFMPDGEFQTFLGRHMYRNPATKYILWEFQRAGCSSGEDCSPKLYRSLQVEHTFPQVPTLPFPACGFHDESAYVDHIHRLGNLTLLTEKEQKQAGNNPLADKLIVYQKSRAPGTRHLAAHLAASKGFSRTALNRRTEQVISFCLRRWSI